MVFLEGLDGGGGGGGWGSENQYTVNILVF
jgi:hypothetical protein